MTTPPKDNDFVTMQIDRVPYWSLKEFDRLGKVLFKREDGKYRRRDLFFYFIDYLKIKEKELKLIEKALKDGKD